MQHNQLLYDNHLKKSQKGQVRDRFGQQKGWIRYHLQSEVIQGCLTNGLSCHA
jgi:hypothetical protein